jgi:cytochrome c oxidase assembly factor CtaG/cytochrome c2
MRTIRRQRVFFLAGWSILALSLVSPLHAMGSVLFSAHMVQHELLMTVAAPLLVLGTPLVSLLWGLPTPARKQIGRFSSRTWFRATWGLVSTPSAAWILHGAAIWIWHAPGLYDASVGSEIAHTAQHASFILTALLFWWSILQPARRGEHGGVAVLLLFTTALHTSLLGALLASADAALYSAYDSTRAWGLTPLEDQQLGGIIMWVPGGIPYVVAALWVLFKWMKLSGDRAPRRRGEALMPLARQAAKLSVMFIAFLGGCGRDTESVADMTLGNAARGRDAMRKYGCQSCHTIPGVRGARALVGPPLAGIAQRSFIAGVLDNSPGHMVEWLRDPPAVAPRTAMPNLGVTEKDARDMTAYLYTLR